ncbi:MAG TPA: TolC family protein [Pyrinomonadaceae bacterium]|nr:TolC family protein [Pyrinomonadaceae bacterium]
MRKDSVSGACALCLLFCLLSQTLLVYGQQPSATTPQQPEAKPGRTQQPQAPRPDRDAPQNPSTSGADAQTEASKADDRPSPYYDYPFGSRTTSRRSLALDEAVSLALSNASAYKQSQFEEQIAREDVKQARAAFFPEITMPLTYFGTTTSRVRAEDEPLTFSYVSSSAINETIALVNASGEIDLSGRLRAQLRRSRHLLAAARAGAQVARRELVLATVDAYYALALARQKRRLADETLGLSEGFVKVSEGLKARGQGEEADLFRAISAARTRRDELEQARASEAAAMDLLRALTGLDFNINVSVRRLTETVPTVTDFLGYTEELIKARPEFNVIAAQKRVAAQEARLARAERLPQLTYNINGGFDAGDFRPLGRYAGGSATVTLTIPIFNFGASRSREAQARLREQQLDSQQESLVRQLRQEFYTTRAAALAALDRIHDAKNASEAAQQNITIIFARYRLRKAEITDVIDAQAAFADSRAAYYQAIADYHTQRVRLEPDPEQVLHPRAVQPETLGTAAPLGCTLNLAQAPVIGGFRLGMTIDEVQARFPNNQIPAPDEFGISTLHLRGLQAPAGSAFEGANNITIEFMDGRLSYIRVSYPPTNQWDNKDEFVANIASRLNVKGRWKPFYDWEDKTIRDSEDLRDMALECEGFRLSAGIGIEGLGGSGDQTPHLELEDITAARTIKARQDEKAARESNEGTSGSK